MMVRRREEPTAGAVVAAAQCILPELEGNHYTPGDTMAGTSEADASVRVRKAARTPSVVAVPGTAERSAGQHFRVPDFGLARPGA